MNRIYDPTSKSVLTEEQMRGMRVLRPVSGYRPTQSPVTGEWFVVETWTNAVMRLEDAPTDYVEAIQESVDIEQLADRIQARACQMELHGEEPSTPPGVFEAREDHTYRTASLAVVVAEARGVDRETARHAYRTLELLDEDLGDPVDAHHLRITEDGVE